MRAIAVLAIKDLRRRLAAPFELALTLAIPLALAGLMALAFGGMASDDQSAASLPKLKIVVVDLDQTILTRVLMGATQSPEMSERVEAIRAADRDAGLKRLYDDKAAALLILPKGLTDAVTGGKPAELELIKNPAQSIMPGVAEQGADVAAFYLSLIARGLGDEAAEARSFLKSDTTPDLAAVGKLLQGLVAKVKGSAQGLFPPLLSIRTVEASPTEKGEGGPTPIGQIMAVMFPGLMIMGLLFLGNAQMKDVLHERRQGTLARQMTAPVSVSQVLVAKMAATAVVVTLGLALLLVLGAFAFHLRWQPAGLTVLACALLVTFVVGFSATLFSLVRSERQADSLGSVVVMILTFLGGAFTPINDPPAWFAAASRTSPIYWGTEVFRSLAGSSPHVPLAHSMAVLAGIALCLALIGIFAMRVRHLRGAL